jgi:hypothetical protein
MGSWNELLSRLPDVLIVLISASLGFLGGIITIPYQLKKQDEKRIRSYVHVATSETHNSFIYAFEMFLSCFCRYKEDVNLIIDHPLSTDILTDVTKGISECLSKGLIESYIRLCQLKETQRMLLISGQKCIEDFRSGKTTPSQMHDNALKFARFSNYIAYTGVMFVKHLPEKLRLMVDGEEELKNGLNRQLKDSKETVLKMLVALETEEKRDHLVSILDEAEKIMEDMEKELFERKFFHIEGTA